MENWISVYEYNRKEKDLIEWLLKEYNDPSNIVYEDVEELKNISNEEEQLKEIKKGKIAQKMLAWIPIVMLLIAIMCGILSGLK